MHRLGRFIADLLVREDGPTAVEYAIMMALILMVCYGAIGSVGSNTGNSLTRSGNATRTTGS